MKIHHSFLAVCFASFLFIFSCKDEPVVNPNEITEDFYFQAVLNGDTVTFQETIQDYYNIVGDFYAGPTSNGYAYTPFTCIAKTAAVTSPTAANLANSGAVAIVRIDSNRIYSQAEYEAFINTGTFQMGQVARDTNQTAIGGAFISVMDANGVEWNSDNGPTATGSLVVTEYLASADNNRIPASHRIVAATFNCTVYNAAGASKLLTGGRVRGRIILW